MEESGEEELRLERLPSASARRVVRALEAHGHEAYLVGGCVRDTLIGRPVSDIDITTSATPEQTIDAARTAGMAVHPTGIAHGTVTVVADGEAMEVTTYRVDGVYRDARHPESVIFSTDVEDDLARRDFTVNAMAYSPASGVLVDPFGGRSDLHAHIIRAVGDPSARFEEDALRIMRALRFSSQLGFSIEERTDAALRHASPLLDRISVERIASELLLLVGGAGAAEAIRTHWDVIATILPELAPMKGFDQHNPHHPYDVAEHTLHALDATPSADPCVRMTLLLHDIGKPDTYHADAKGGHFYGHAKRSAVIARNVLVRLRYPRAFTDEVVKLVENHGAPIIDDPKNVKRWMRRLGHDSFYRLLDVKRGDVGALCARDQKILPLFDRIESTAHEIDEEHACFSLKDLAITGDDLLAAGVERGPLIGRLLKTALDAVIDEAVPNEKPALMAFIEGYLWEGDDLHA